MRAPCAPGSRTPAQASESRGPTAGGRRTPGGEAQTPPRRTSALPMQNSPGTQPGQLPPSGADAPTEPNNHLHDVPGHVHRGEVRRVGVVPWPLPALVHFGIRQDALWAWAMCGGGSARPPFPSRNDCRQNGRPDVQAIWTWAKVGTACTDAPGGSHADGREPEPRGSTSKWTPGCFRAAPRLTKRGTLGGLSQGPLATRGPCRPVHRYKIHAAPTRAPPRQTGHGHRSRPRRLGLLSRTGLGGGRWRLPERGRGAGQDAVGGTECQARGRGAPSLAPSGAGAVGGGGVGFVAHATLKHVQASLPSVAAGEAVRPYRSRLRGGNRRRVWGPPAFDVQCLQTGSPRFRAPSAGAAVLVCV